MITPLRLRNRASALRAIPRIVLHPPPRKSIVPQYNALVLVAREAFVADGAALGGD